MPWQPCRSPELESAAWNGIQEAVRSFRRAWRRGEQPAIEAYLPGEACERKPLLLELIHEEMELRFEAGETPGVAPYLERFPELAGDPTALRELSQAVRPSTIGERAVAAARPPARIGRYELGAVIGRGAFGVVHRARDTILDRVVALKRPRPGLVESPEAAERFLREARSAAALGHPHIVTVHDAGQADGELYLVSTMVEGRNLADELAARRPGFRQAVEWVAALAEALEHAHGLGIIHRDVKPSNVLIDREDKVYLTDFGLAKSDSGDATWTCDGQVLGTPAYMAPEQARGDKERIGAGTDVYSLGAILYELLTGSRPFTGAGAMLLMRIREEDPRPPRRLDHTIPPDLETVCLKAMAKEPSHRYAAAAAFAADLRRWLRGEPVQARLVGPIGTLWRTCRRQPVVSGLAASLVLAVALGGAGAVWQWRRAHAQRDQALQALNSAIATMRSALDLSLEDSGHPQDLQQRRDAILDSARTSLLDQVRLYPELRDPLASNLMAALSLIDRTAPDEDAFRSSEKTRRSLEDLVRCDPTFLAGRDYVARCLAAEGTLLVRMGRIAEAEARLRQSVDQWQVFHAMAAGPSPADPARLSAREAWIGTELNLADAQARRGRESEAAATCRRALAQAEELMREQPGSARARRRLAYVHGQWASLIRAARPSEAIAALRRALALLEPIIAREPPSQRAVQEELGRDLYLIAVWEDRLDWMAEAIRDFRRTIAVVEGLGRHQPLDLEFRGLLATSYHVLGRLLVDTGRPGEALEPYRTSIALREAMSRDDPKNPRWHSDCAGSWYRLSEAWENLGRLVEAVAACEQSVAHQRLVCSRAPRELKHRRFLDERLRQLFRLGLSLGRPDEAAAWARERKTLWPNDPAAALSVAGQLAAAAALIRPDESVWTILLSPDRRCAAVAAVAAAREAAGLLARNPPLTQSVAWKPG